MVDCRGPCTTRKGTPAAARGTAHLCRPSPDIHPHGPRRTAASPSSAAGTWQASIVTTRPATSVRSAPPSPTRGFCTHCSVFAEGIPLGKTANVQTGISMVTIFGWFAPHAEKTLFAPQPQKVMSTVHGHLITQCLLHTAGSGGAQVDSQGHLLAVNSISWPDPTIPMPYKDYKAYGRMVSDLTSLHGLQTRLLPVSQRVECTHFDAFLQGFCLSVHFYIYWGFRGNWAAVVGILPGLLKLST